MKLIKRLLLRLRLANARFYIRHWSGRISLAATDDRIEPEDIAWMMQRKADAVIDEQDILRDLADLDAPDDDSEQLSKRAIPAHMFWPK